MKERIIMQEIERKFLIDRFPDNYPLLETAELRQGYLSTAPTVRIREKINGGTRDYRLCIKGEGTLVRAETEIEISKEVYDRLADMLVMPPVIKHYRVYALPGGYRLECNLVDPGESGEFMYAEVEFESEEQAMAFEPPSCVGRDVTEQPGYSMASYWEKKSAEYSGAFRN